MHKNEESIVLIKLLHVFCNPIRRDAAHLIWGFASGSVSHRCWFRAVWIDTLGIKQWISQPECQKVVFETTVGGRCMKSPLLCGKIQGTQTTANECCLCLRSRLENDWHMMTSMWITRARPLLQILPCLNSHHFIYRSLWISTWHQNWPNACCSWCDWFNSYSKWRVLSS